MYNVIHVVVFGQSAWQGRVRVKQTIPAEDRASHCDIDAYLDAGSVLTMVDFRYIK